MSVRHKRIIDGTDWGIRIFKNISLVKAALSPSKQNGIYTRFFLTASIVFVFFFPSYSIRCLLSARNKHSKRSIQKRFPAMHSRRCAQCDAKSLLIPATAAYGDREFTQAFVMSARVGALPYPSYARGRCSLKRNKDAKLLLRLYWETRTCASNYLRTHAIMGARTHARALPCFSLQSNVNLTKTCTRVKCK